MKNIDKLLEHSKNAKIPEFPFSDEQVRTVLENADSKNKTKVIKNGAIIMTFLISIIAFMLYFGVDSANIESRKIESNSINSQSKIENQTISKAEIENTQQNIDTIRVQKVQQPSENKNKSKIYDIAMNEVAADSKDVITIIIPDKEELEKLFIKKTNCGYVLMSEKDYPVNQSKEQMEQIYKNNYPKKGYKRSIQALNTDDIEEIGIANYSGWDMKNSLGIFPIMTKLISIDKRFKNTKRFLSTASPNPIDISELSDIVNSKFLRFIHNTLEKFDNKNAGNELKITCNKDEYEYLSQVSLVLLNLDNDTTSSYWLLVYPNTRNFLKLLPNRFNKESNFDLFSDFGMDYDESEIKREINLAINNMKGECKSKKDENKQKSPTTVSKISGIEKIVLTRDEASQIGIEFNNNTLSFEAEEYSDLSVLPDKTQKYIETEYNYNTNGFALLKENVQFDLNNSNTILRPTVIKYSGWDHKIWSDISPTCITLNRQFEKGNKVISSHIFQNPYLVNDSTFHYFNTDDIVYLDSLGVFKAKISNLIPVNFNEISYDNNGDSIINTIEIWYVVTEEFAEKLPAKYRIPILNELKLIKNINNGELSLDDACEVLKGAKSFLGLCDLIGDEISILKVFPNPVSGNNATIEFYIKTARNIKIEAFNSNGELIDILQDFKAYDAGNSKVELNLSNVQTGVIQISISDESSNRKTIKILKN